MKNSIPLSPVGFFRYCGFYRSPLIISTTLLTIVAISLAIASEYSFKCIIDHISGVSIDIRLYTLVALFGGTLLLRNILFRTSGITGNMGINKIRTHYQSKIYKHCLNHSQSFFADTFSGSINQNINNIDRSFIGLSAQMLWYVPSFLTISIISIILGFQAHWIIGAGFLVWIIITSSLVIIFLPMIKRFSRKFASLQSKTSGITIDVFSNIQHIYGSSRQAEIFMRDQLISEQNHTLINKYYRSEAMKLITWGVGMLFIIGILIISLQLWSKGMITPGDVVLFLTLSNGIFKIIKDTTRSLDRATEEYGTLQKSLESIAIPHDMEDTPNAQILQINNGEIICESLDFSYQKGVEIFKDFLLNIPSEQRLGLVGKSGAGKSTFIQLLMRRYHLNKGSISIDSQDISQITLDSLKSSISYVPQDTTMFHRSVAENIAYGSPNASQAEVESAAKKAHAHDFIMQLPGEYNSMVGERGVKLSGGQRQRIAIARAILQNRKILILDEATSALDSESELAIQKALNEVMKGKTVITIAHRLSTLRQMDRIIVLEDGKIQEDGDHNTLIDQKGIYADLWDQQAGGFIQE